MNKLLKINDQNLLVTDKDSDNEYLALKIYKLIKSTSREQADEQVGAIAKEQASDYTESHTNKASLETILYFTSLSDLYNISLEVKDDSNLITQILYRLTITSEDELINNKIVYCSQEFIHALFVEHSHLLEGVKIDRPSLAVCELLSDAIENAVTKLVKNNTNGVIN